MFFDRNIQEVYDVQSVINSHIFKCTAIYWFYSHNISSVHGHELIVFKIQYWAVLLK